MAVEGLQNAKKILKRTICALMGAALLSSAAIARPINHSGKIPSRVIQTTDCARAPWTPLFSDNSVQIGLYGTSLGTKQVAHLGFR